MANRLAAAAVLGLVLLALSALINIANGTALGGPWPPIWIGWLVAAIIVVGVTFGAPTVRAAWGRLSFINFIASSVLIASLPWRGGGVGASASAMEPLGLSPPLGAALGGAILSGAMGIAAVLAAIVFLIFSYLLLRRNRERHA